MDRSADLKLKMMRHFDFNKVEVPSIFDVALMRLRRRTIEVSEPTGREATRGGMRGERETYPGRIIEGSAAEEQELIVEMQKEYWKGRSDTNGDAEKRIAAHRARTVALGLQQSRHQTETRGLTYTNKPPEYMVGYERDGTETHRPVLGGATPWRSKYADLKLADETNSQMEMLGESKFAKLADPPRLRNGEIDYDELNRRNGRTTNSGPRNMTIRRG
jgi:hypothetical protein